MKRNGLTKAFCTFGGDITIYDVRAPQAIPIASIIRYTKINIVSCLDENYQGFEDGNYIHRGTKSLFHPDQSVCSFYDNTVTQGFTCLMSRTIHFKWLINNQTWSLMEVPKVAIQQLQTGLKTDRNFNESIARFKVNGVKYTTDIGFRLEKVLFFSAELFTLQVLSRSKVKKANVVTISVVKYGRTSLLKGIWKGSEERPDLPYLVAYIMYSIVMPLSDIICNKLGQSVHWISFQDLLNYKKMILKYLKESTLMGLHFLAGRISNRLVYMDAHFVAHTNAFLKMKINDWSCHHIFFTIQWTLTKKKVVFLSSIQLEYVTTSHSPKKYPRWKNSLETLLYLRTSKPEKIFCGVGTIKVMPLLVNAKNIKRIICYVSPELDSNNPK